MAGTPNRGKVGKAITVNTKPGTPVIEPGSTSNNKPTIRTAIESAIAKNPPIVRTVLR